MSFDPQEDVDLDPETAALQALAEDLVAAALATRASEALLLRAQISLLAWLSVGERREDVGYPKLCDLVLMKIGMSVRTLQERLRLHRLFVRFPALEAAFVEGRMSLCQVMTAAPIFEETDPQDAASVAFWCEVAGGTSVRTLKAEVRSRKEEGKLKAELEEEGQRISFRAPAPFRVQWDEVIDLARKELGGDAAVHTCVAAILAEAEEAGRGPLPAKPRWRERRGIPVRPRRLVPANPTAIAHARETLRQTFAYIRDVQDLIESGEPGTGHDAVDALKQIERLWAPQDVLFCHLIRDLRATYAMDLLGYRSMAELVEDRLDLSERSARNRVAESLLFESNEEIEAAFGRGEISLLQAHLIKVLASGTATGPFIERAREVTWRQFQREARILELLRRCGLGEHSRKPLPDSKLEEALFEALGGNGEGIEARLRDRGLPPLPPDGSTDPAENSIRMERLEALVEMLVLTQWDEMPKTAAGRDRQTFAPLQRETTISFWAPDATAGDLLHAIEKIRHRARPAAPSWMAMMVILTKAQEEWLRKDPKRRPSGAKIFQRDNYRCIVPGCSSRAHLEDHHNQFRSQGGSDDPDNRSTLCHGHHRRGVHRGRIRITGTARHRLRFEIGCRPDGPPLLTLQGEKIIHPVPR